jgi:hypothetical protein
VVVTVEVVLVLMIGLVVVVTAAAVVVAAAAAVTSAVVAVVVAAAAAAVVTSAAAAANPNTGSEDGVVITCEAVCSTESARNYSHDSLPYQRSAVGYAIKPKCKHRFRKAHMIFRFAENKLRAYFFFSKSSYKKMLQALY